MSDLAYKFSAIGLHTFSFEQKFKKVLLFLEAIDEPQIFYVICQFFDVHDLLAFTSTSRRFHTLKQSPIIQVKILRQKIKSLQQPKKDFILLNQIPSYCDFLFQQKIQKTQISQNSVNISDKFKEYHENLRRLKQYKKNKSIKRELIQNQISYLNKKLNQNQVGEFRLYEKIRNSLIVQIKPQIEPNGTQFTFVQTMPADLKVNQINQIAQQQSFITEEKPKQVKRGKSYVEKFREQIKKGKEFEQKQNIIRLQQLHKQTSQQIKKQAYKNLAHKNEVQSIKNVENNIPIIRMNQGQRLFVRQQTVMDRLKDKVGFIFRLK